MAKRYGFWLVCSLLLLVGFTFRFAIVRYLTIEPPDDGKVYSQLAQNLITQCVYSHETEPPYQPSIIRVPGYPLLLAGVYRLFGLGNDAAVKIVQALFDTVTCALVGLIAFFWEPDSSRKYVAAIAALALAVVCPFSTIYTATILTETPTIFLTILMSLTATMAFRSHTTKLSIVLWVSTGIICGVAVLFRPDCGLFAAVIGVTLLGEVLRGRDHNETERAPTQLRRRFARPALLAAVFSAAFCLVLTPWTVRNRRVFHVFQPLAPRHAEMPGEFVPYGYLLWVRTWIQDERYIGPALWKLDEAPIDVDELPDQAFDSPDEKKQVATLLEKYSYPQGDTVEQNAQLEPDSGSLPAESQADAPPAASDEFDLNDQEKLDESQPGPDAEPDQLEQNQDVKMTPEIDAAFARIARERISRSPIRYYVTLPFRRGVSLWFDTHSDYYPFEGELMPLGELDRTTNQHVWLPLFAALTWIYTLVGVAGAWLLWRRGDFDARRWVVLVALMIFLRLAFFATLENPEPRYVVEIFPFLSILGGITIARIASLPLREWYKAKRVRVQ